MITRQPSPPPSLRSLRHRSHQWPQPPRNAVDTRCRSADHSARRCSAAGTTPARALTVGASAGLRERWVTVVNIDRRWVARFVPDLYPRAGLPRPRRDATIDHAIGRETWLRKAETHLGGSRGFSRLPDVGGPHEGPSVNHQPSTVASITRPEVLGQGSKSASRLASDDAVPSAVVMIGASGWCQGYPWQGG